MNLKNLSRRGGGNSTTEGGSRSLPVGHRRPLPRERIAVERVEELPDQKRFKSKTQGRGGGKGYITREYLKDAGLKKRPKRRLSKATNTWKLPLSREALTTVS